MQIIPNKYLRTNGNRIQNGPSSMLKANNVVFDNGKILSRLGQQLMEPEDPVGQAYDPIGYQSIKPVKIFYYNNRIWGYFSNPLNYDLIGYFDPNVPPYGRWLYSLSPSTWPTTKQISPQFASSNKRLFYSSSQGVFSSPTLDNAEDQILVNLSTYQTNLRRTGCPAAIPFDDIFLFNTTAPPTYNSDFLPVNARVAYRHVWKYIDANGAVIYGAVSDRWEIQNTDPGARATAISVYIPLQIIDGTATQRARYSVQIYRSETSLVNAAGFAPSPSDQMYLVAQLRPTVADLAAGTLPFTDILADNVLQGPLYTNQTQQGLAASRIRPPMAETICDYAGSLWFGNVTDRWSLPFQLVSVVDSGAGGAYQKGLANNDILVIGQRCFEAKNVALGPLVGPEENQFQIFQTAGLANGFNRLNDTKRSLAYKFNRDFNRPYYDLQTISGPDDLSAQFSLNERTDALLPDTKKPYIGLYRAAGWAGTGGPNPSPIVPTPIVGMSPSSGIIGAGFRIIRMQAAGPGYITFTLDSAPDFAVDDTVNIARLNVYSDPALAVGSQGDGVVNIVPGQWKVRTISGADVTIDGQVTSGAFNQQVGVAPFATLWTHLGVVHCVYSQSLQMQSSAVGIQKKTKNRAMFSAFQEPENAPALNYIDIGSSDKSIIKMINLGQSMFVFKQDGLYRVGGIYPQFSLQLFDPNIVLIGPDLVTTMGGRLYAFATNGIFQISQNNSKRISYDIQNIINALILNPDSGLKRYGFAVGNQADHSVCFWTGGHHQSAPMWFALVYDGQGWSTRDDNAISGASGIDQSTGMYSMFTMKSYGSGWLTRQRRTMTGIDYCDQQIEITVASMTIIGPTTINVTLPALTSTSLFSDQWIPVGSCVLVGDPAFQRRAYITSVLGIGPNSFQFQLQFLYSEYTTADWSTDPSAQLTIILGYKVEWQYGINSQNDPASRKHFSQVGFVFQQPYFSIADVGFSSDISPRTQYLISNLKGFAKINDDPTQWPIMTDDYDLAQKTIRAIVSKDHARCSQLRVSFRHIRAIQFISCYGHFIKSSPGGKNIQRNNQNV